MKMNGEKTCEFPVNPDKLAEIFLNDYIYDSVAGKAGSTQYTLKRWHGHFYTWDVGKYCKLSAEKREAIEALYHYISINEEQMRYDVFRNKGYDIGSGAVEGACKHVVGKRLKQSGMI